MMITMTMMMVKAMITIGETNLVFTSFLFRILSIPSPLCLNYNFFIFMDFSDPGISSEAFQKGISSEGFQKRQDWIKEEINSTVNILLNPFNLI